MKHNPDVHPRISTHHDEHRRQIIETVKGDAGITLMDHFAGLIMNGILSYSYCNQGSGNWVENSDYEGRAEFAYEQAKAMLRERKKHFQNE